MWEVKLEPSVIFSYSAGISACEKGQQWQWALALLGEMCEARLKPNVIFSCNAAISACGKGEQWQRALALLGEMCQAKLEPSVLATTLGSARARRASSGSGHWRCSARCVRRSWCPAQLQRWDQRLREGQTVAAGFDAAQRNLGGEAGAQRLQLQRFDQRVREERGVAAGSGAAAQDV
ncbi:unnamed protein product [Prorocentrum cordatum]|uniref:Pentatricopeptide repeat-containing protein, chloroplastic n=1 Tax=Prorocentrum cordatum TaxID=2364126 RepID=A0ABN9TAH5_9DINO|nr:unnamed protein product [Polarella glacialis]